MRNTGPITVRKLHPLFGAEITGIDITRPLSQREFGPIRAAFEEHSVLLFRDQHMDDEKQIQFSEYFGPLETTGAANPAAPYVINVSPSHACGDPVNLRLTISCTQVATPFTYDFSFPTGPTCTPPLGSCDPDLNQDGVADQGDIDYLINVVAGGPNPTGIDADFNHDGVADQGDIDALVNVVAGGPCP